MGGGRRQKAKGKRQKGGGERGRAKAKGKREVGGEDRGRLHDILRGEIIRGDLDAQNGVKWTEAE
jgi:hypothetical protein